jgi:mRNA-degrading endonuclease YafQ of YafQ-DinJ toxin-antitoxin module
MYTIAYKPSFIKVYKKLHTQEKEEIKERIEALRDPLHHQKLKVHKLSGKLSGFYSFSVSFSERILFQYGDSGKEIILIEFGDHSLYR